MDFDMPNAANASWPANHRAALVVFIHVISPGLDGTGSSHAIGEDYTATGFQRLLRMLADLDVPATTAWNTQALSTFPQLARSAQDQGHELALSRVGSGSTAQEDSVLGRISDIPLNGVIDALPGEAQADRAAATGANQQVSWNVTGVGGDVPISTAGANGQGTTVIPVSPYWIDSTWLDPVRPLPPSSLLEAWSLSLAAVRTEGGLMTVVLHPHISGRPGFAGQIERFLDEVIESGDVWIANAAQLTEWWRRQETDG